MRLQAWPHLLSSPSSPGPGNSTQEEQMNRRAGFQCSKLLSLSLILQIFTEHSLLAVSQLDFGGGLVGRHCPCLPRAQGASCEMGGASVINVPIMRRGNRGKGQTSLLSCGLNTWLIVLSDSRTFLTLVPQRNFN